MAARKWPTLNYLDLGEIEDGEGNTLFSMPTATPDDDLGERVCVSFNCFDDMLAALKAQHDAIDTLFAMLVMRDAKFLPSKSGAWAALVQGNVAIAKAEGRS